MSAPLWVGVATAVTRLLPRGRYRALQWLAGRAAPAPFWARAPGTLGGFRWHCDLRDAIAREVCYTGCYEPPETALVQSILRPGATFVDVGANWGYFTLLAACQLGDAGRVVSLEPDPRLFATLQANLAENRLTTVRPVQVAAHRTNGPVSLTGFSEAEGNFGLSRLTADSQATSGFTVTARTLDDLLQELAITNVDLVKMDIEGGEGFALRGLSRSLAGGHIRRVLLELHPEYLPAHGYTVASAVLPLLDAGLEPWTVDHSASAYRRALGWRGNASRFLTPWDRLSPLGAWPHLLWTLPGDRPTV